MMQRVELMKFRETKGLSVSEIAEYLKSSISHYYKIEEGFKDPSFRFLEGFKATFPDASINEILFQTKSHRR
jgi:predicted transcriptional regulator